MVISGSRRQSSRLDGVIGRAAALFDTVVVAVLVNPDKSGLFDLSERRELLDEVTGQWPNVRVDSFSGLLVDYCREQGAQAIVKGLRVVSDFEWEFQMNQLNRHLAPDIETAVAGVVGQTPLGRLAEMPEVASAAVFLCSDAARFITGIGLPVEGGMGS